jgi:phage tail sheath protein FI
MATYNRPGVYLEEVSSSFPVSSSPTATIATFTGALVRGPIAATLVTSWNQFTSLFGDISANSADQDLAVSVYLFFANGGSQCYIQRTTVTITVVASAATTNSTALTVSAYSGLTDSAGNTGITLTAAMIKGAVITGQGISVGTYITAYNGTTGITLSQAASIPSSATLAISTALLSSTTIYGNTTATIPAGAVTGGGTTSITLTTGTSVTVANQTPTGTTNITMTIGAGAGIVPGNLVTISGVTPSGYNGQWTAQAGTSGTTLVVNIGSNPGATTGAAGAVIANHGLKVGQTVVIGGASFAPAAYAGTFVVTAVPTANSFTYTNPLAPTGSISTAGTVTAQSGNAELTLIPKSPGLWGNSIYYEISNSTVSTGYPGKYFNLAIYYNGTGAGNIVERFSDLTMLSSDSSYAPAIINSSSNYITAIDANATNHTAANFANTNTPLTTALVALNGIAASATSASTSVVLTTDPGISIGMFVSGNGVTSGTTVTAYNSGTKTVTLSAAMSIPAATYLTFTNSPLTGGADGSAVNNTAVAATTALAKLDVITQPILLNAAGVTEAANVNNMLNYAYNRGDTFVIIDSTQATFDATSQLALTNTYTGGAAGVAGMGFGAVYFPNLTIPNPTSSAPGSVLTAYPGGAVAAKYVTTDSSRGVFKSPAGLEARLSGVVSVASLTNTELDYLNNGTVNPNTFTNATPVNAIRYIPGSGIVVMGARTLSSTYASRYISVRRSLIYLRKILSDSTAFALFETNDQRLWNRLQTTCEAILINFWQSGGLKGATALDAFYVKSDNTLNTAASIAAGEVHLEVGVALQRPAEFVVIRISQYDSGSVVTVL